MSQCRQVSPFKATCVVLAFTAFLAAQQAPTTDPVFLLRADAQRRAEWAEGWLRSEDPLRVAWGAWLARQDRQTNLIPLLIEKVEEYQPTQQPFTQTLELDRHDSLLVVLDALIGLGAAVPVKEVRKLYPGFAAQSMILLVRSQNDAQSELLDIFHQARANWNWLAAGNVLMKNRTPGFTALLLSRFTQHITVTVIDPGVGGGFGGGSSECGFSLRAPKQGWPPVGLYDLTQFPDRLTGVTPTFLVGGETTVYYMRVEPGNYDNPPDASGDCNDGNRDTYRAQYLNKMLDSSSGISLDPYPQVSIVWRNEGQYRQQLTAALEEKRARFRGAVVKLQDSDRVLTAAESATLQPRVEIVIYDQRANKSVPLPALSGRDGRATVRTAFAKPLY